MKITIRITVLTVISGAAIAMSAPVFAAGQAADASRELHEQSELTTVAMQVNPTDFSGQGYSGGKASERLSSLADRLTAAADGFVEAARSGDSRGAEMRLAEMYSGPAKYEAVPVRSIQSPERSRVPMPKSAPEFVNGPGRVLSPRLEEAAVSGVTEPEADAADGGDSTEEPVTEPRGTGDSDVVLLFLILLLICLL